MFFGRKLVFVYIFIIICGISISSQKEGDDSESSEKSIAAGLSEDMDKLSENVNEISEDYGENESDEPGTPEEKKKQRISKKFGAVYQKDFEKAQKVVDRQYAKFVKGTYESLDLLEYAVEGLKRFWYTGQCRRNYDQKCPKGWTEIEGVCKAPEDYKGLCNDSKNFEGIGPKEKEDFAWRCEVEWPCVNEKPLSEGLECPLEWAPISDSLCLAPKTYDGICSPIIDISKLDIEKKSFYEYKCDLRWRRIVTNAENGGSENGKEISKQNQISGVIEDGIVKIIKSS